MYSIEAYDLKCPCLRIHIQRLKEMRHLTKDPNAAAKARASEQKANEEAGLKSINISLSGSGTTKKKPVFKSTLQPEAGATTETKPVGSLAEGLSDASGAVANGWFEERYRPQFVNGCEEEGCRVCEGGRIDLGEV